MFEIELETHCQQIHLDHMIGHLNVLGSAIQACDCFAPLRWGLLGPPGQTCACQETLAQDLAETPFDADLEGARFDADLEGAPFEEPFGFEPQATRPMQTLQLLDPNEPTGAERERHVPQLPRLFIE